MQKKYNKFLIIFLLLSCLHPCVATAKTHAKNIILLISDGAGLSHISYNLQKNSGSNYKRFKNIGLIETSSANAAITDSAAAATTFATGKKTYNGAIGLDFAENVAPTILEIAKQNGLSVGVTVTCSVTHATPAAFLAHQKMREMENEIAQDIVKSEVDVLIGGGLQFFNESQLEQLRKNYKIYQNSSDLFADNYEGKIIALLAKNALPKISEGRQDYSVKALEKSLKILSKNKKGFFLMFEGSQIDWGAHANDASYIAQEMVDFDKALGVALDFASKHKDTLVIALSDHETGGFALTGSFTKNKEDYGEVAPKFTSKGHSATMIPVFAYGPQSLDFAGVYGNDEIFTKMCNALNLKCF